MKKKIKKIKLFFVAFLGVCLGLTSFSSAGTVEIPFIFSDPGIEYPFSSQTNFMFGFDNKILYTGGFEDTVDYCVYIDSGYNSELANFSMNVGLGLVYSRNGQNIPTANGNYNIFSPAENFISFTSSNGVCGTYTFNTSSDFKYFNNFRITLIPDHQDIINPHFSGKLVLSSPLLSVVSAGGSSDCSQDSNYLQCLEDKNLLIGQVSTLSGSLSICQSDLSSCRGGQDASLLACIDQKEQCESSLITLSGNYASLENMNSSLSSQLQECLESGGSGSSDLICNTYDLFWDSDNTRYSFPINNNLILPAGYKGFVNEGVLAIKQDNNNAYSISDDDFQNVMDSYGVVFLYLFGGALFLMFLFIMRKYFIGLKS